MISPLSVDEVNIDGDVVGADNAAMTFVDWGRMVGIASSSNMGDSYVEISREDAAKVCNWLIEFLDGE